MNNIINNNMKHYCMYLRKSRKDMEAEKYGEGETLARHEAKLLELATSMNIKIGKIYREIKSGESISARPVMQELLSDVENGMWEGVLVIEVERLARGNTLDQGIVSNAFQYSNTKIITPLKTYDPNNECDEEYFEFGLFMSRREYKKINQRLRAGILASIKEGKHTACAPFGYQKYKLSNQKGFTLKIDENEAEIVRMMFDLYISGNGITNICNTLNKMGIKTKRNKEFGKTSVATILSNPVYIGKIKYVNNASTKKVTNGKIVRIKNPNSEMLLIDGMHEPIISAEIWNKAQEVRKGRNNSCVKIDYSIKNPMASLLKCGICGKALTRSVYVNRKDVRVCCKHCSENIGSNIEIVEEKLIQYLKILLKDYKIKVVNEDYSDIELELNNNNEYINNYHKEIIKLTTQLNNTYDLLEQAIYDNKTFLERSNLIKNKISNLENEIKKLEDKNILLEKNKFNKITLIPKIQNVIECYYQTNNVSEKNELLKSVLKKIEYTKINPCSKDDFKLKLYPKLQ